MRVPKHCGIEALEYSGKLKHFGQWGYFRDVSYHLKKQISMNLFCGKNDRDEDDPAFIISDTDDIPNLIYGKRMQIEEGFRSLSSVLCKFPTCWFHRYFSTLSPKWIES
jgi:hypothetical protein